MQLSQRVVGRTLPLIRQHAYSLNRRTAPLPNACATSLLGAYGPQWLPRRSRSALPETNHDVAADSIPPPGTYKGKAASREETYVDAVLDGNRPTVNADGQDRVCPYNAVGVQLLSGSLQRQIFPPTAASVPSVEEDALSLSQHHLRSHGLEPEQASTTKPIAFDLPPLQGENLDQHFWNIGRQAAQPWLGMAHNLAAASVYEQLPQGLTTAKEFNAHKDGAADEGNGSFAPVDWLALDPSLRLECPLRPPKWLKVPGWVRYPVLRGEDGAQALASGTPVEYPLEEDGALVFDVETMVKEGNFAIMATAVGANAWYSWLSPWLLQQGHRHNEKDHLIPFGPADSAASTAARLLVGHNVNFDRARIRDEYSLKRSNIRFLDTMSLHVATRGISSPQRGAWADFKKKEKLRNMLREEGIEEEKKGIIRALLVGQPVDEETLANHDLDLIVSAEKGGSPAVDEIDNSEQQTAASSLWQTQSSNNALADVAKLHCNIDMKKETRNVFVECTDRRVIVDKLDELLTYCATDVLVTHKVFTKVWPAFQANCPNPATVAGVFGLSGVILPVDSEWDEYIERCDALYESTRQEVQDNLVALAEHLRVTHTKGVSWEDAQAVSEANAVPLDHPESLDHLGRESQRRKMSWEKDRWASQLDWTPKKPKVSKVMFNADTDHANDVAQAQVPRWYRDMVLKSTNGIGPGMALTPAVLRLALEDEPFIRDGRQWSSASGATQSSLMTKKYLAKDKQGIQVCSLLGPAGTTVLSAIRRGENSDIIRQCLRAAADELLKWGTENPEDVTRNEQLRLLDWELVDAPASTPKAAKNMLDGIDSVVKRDEWWPQWYWELYKSKTGKVDITVRSKVTPLLLHLSWQRCPLHRSREHGWVFRYDPDGEFPLLTRQKVLDFNHPDDQMFRNDIKRTVAEQLAKHPEDDRININVEMIKPRYYKVPHAAGDDSNVGTPFSKSFVPYFEKGTLQSEHPEEESRLAAKNALESNARCSYWISVRDRVTKQMVVWDGQGNSKMHIPNGISGTRQDDQAEGQRKKGLILPQIIPMGTVTRRAIEKTWLTASNAKKNRVGSELKSMVKAPPGFSIVGADVDSQELWICSVMGDAQFGFHGATAVGWMTLEGSKAMGTDLHSKTAKILGTTRNQAKVFNYSRIYGAGLRHSSQLLLQAWPDMSTEEAMRRAKALYASTKGTNTRSDDFFERPFWFGGTESFVFNKLEAIALLERPTTPALGCGVTVALQRKYLPSKSARGSGMFDNASHQDYMPSRINWVVQSSGVDYLHLLITAMEHLIAAYNLEARFMISVHDEVRYLAKDEDVERVALALQVANLWTRAMFAHKLQMDTLPQGVGFFAQVDVDKVLRKETDDPCVTPSQPAPLPFGHALDIYKTLDNTHGGSLFADGRPMHSQSALDEVKRNRARHVASRTLPPGEAVDVESPQYTFTPQQHRAMGERGLRYLQAQASSDFNEVAVLEERVRRQEGRQQGRVRSTGSRSRKRSGRDNVDWEEVRLARLESMLEQPRTARSDVRAGNTGARLQKRSSIDTPRALHTSALPPSLSPLVERFPPRPPKLHVSFYKTSLYRFTMKWKVYAALLRQCPKEHRHIRGMIQSLMRAKRHLTSIAQTSALRRRADALLVQFEQARKGDAAAQGALQEMDEKVGQQQHERYWWQKANMFAKEQEEAAKPTPRTSGALLPPSMFNPPLLRYKPRQPDHITMMIVKRRCARMRRQERWADCDELMQHVRYDFKAFEGNRLSTPLGGRPAEWLDPIVQHEMTLMSEAYAREVARQKMVFSTRMLRFAKHARLRRDRLHGRRRHAERQTREEAQKGSDDVSEATKDAGS